MSALLRFFAVTLVGLALDLALALALHRLAGAPLCLAASAGFVVAAGANYVLHQLWSFGHAHSRLSARRAGAYFAASLLTLTVRVGIVALLARLTGGGAALAILIAGAGGSCAVNYALSRWVVFAPHPADREAA
jgi:putative flippase GtrA